MKMMVVSRFLAFSLLTLCPQIFLIASALNFSTIFFSSHAITIQPPPLPSSHFLKDVLKVISLKQNWKLEDLGVSKVRNYRIGNSHKYEFRIRMGKTHLLFRFSGEVSPWRKIKKKGNFDSFYTEISSKTVLGMFELAGPFELRVDGDDELNLMLPLNITHSRLKRLIVGEGITVKVEGAREISLYQSSDFGLPINRSMGNKGNRDQYWPFKHSSCMLLPPIRIIGSASLRAYKTNNPNSYIKSTFLSRDMVKLLPEKCYSGASYRRQGCPITALSPRLDLLEKVLRSFPGERLLHTGISSFLKAKITTSTLVKFELELERNIQYNDTFWGTLAEWRTKPTSERVHFEVVARVDGERLVPLVVKKVRPFIAADSTAWSTLTSNISFTKFPSVVGPPEGLTLDVKW